MTNWIPWLIGGGVVLAGGAALALSGRGGAPVSPQSRPLPDPATMTDAQAEAISRTMVAELNALGYGPLTADAQSGDAFYAAAARFAAQHPGAAAVTSDSSDADNARFIAAVDDAYRARFGLPAAGTSGSLALVGLFLAGGAPRGVTASSGTLALRRARALRRSA